MVDPFHVGDGLTVYNADLLDALPLLEPGSVDAVVTSPPYAMQRASTYGGVPEKDYPDWTVAWMDALKPALAERGSVMLNISPHVKGGMLSDYVLRMRLALRADGWFEHDELIWYKKNAFPSGRKDRPVRAWESIFWYSLTGKPHLDMNAVGTASVREAGYHRAAKWIQRGGASNTTPAIAAPKNVVQFGVGGTTGFTHPAPFPWKLAEWCAKLICPPGGTVLDPFAGSGSTAVAASRNGFQSVAIEREPEYAQMIVDRYNAELAKVNDTLPLGLSDAKS